MNRFKNTATAAALSSVLCLAMSSAPAVANDFFTAPGSSCLPDRPSDDYKRSFSGRFSNESSESMVVTCTGIIPSSTALFPDNDVSIRVDVEDLSYVDDIQCTLRLSDVNGSQYRSYTRATSGTGGQSLDFSGVLYNESKSYYLRCRVPGIYENNTSRLVGWSISR